MKFVVVGLSHKTAPLEVREQAFLADSSVGPCLQRLGDRDLIESGVLLSTCNRTELYALCAGDDAEQRLVEAFGSWPHALAYDTWRRHAYYLTDDDAMRHLFMVAAGLDSMVLGEAQILGQLRQALTLARQADRVDGRLQVILQGALRAGKRVRHETDLGRRPVSVGHAAVTRAIEVFGDLRGRHVLLVGAGPMSQAALNLLKNQKIGSVYVASRTLERASGMVDSVGGEAIEMAQIPNVIGAVDVVLTSSSAQHHLFEVDDLAGWQARRANRPLVVIDLAVPRDVAPAAGRVEGLHLFNIDDLQTVALTNLEERKAAVLPAERIVEAELARTRSALGARDAAPTAQALVRRVEAIRDQELQRHLATVTDPGAREAMEQLASGLTAKFLDGPIRSLRDSPEPAVETAVLSDAFDLDL